jgi:hypothetical protein
MARFIFRVSFEGTIDTPDDTGADNRQPIIKASDLLSEVKEQAIRYVPVEQRGLMLKIDRVRSDLALPENFKKVKEEEPLLGSPT